MMSIREYTAPPCRLRPGRPAGLPLTAALLLLVPLLLPGRAARAAEAFVQAGDPLGFLHAGATSGGALSLLAYSRQGGPPPAGPNAVTFDTGTGGPAAHLEGATVPDWSGRFPGIGFRPVVGYIGDKGSERAARSTSGMADAEARYVPRGAVPGAPAAALVAAAMVGLSGSAAVEVKDDYALPVGLYEYAPVIDRLSLSVAAGESGGVNVFATDSRFGRELWWLGIGVHLPFSVPGRADLTVSFLSNPILGLDDAAVNARLRAALAPTTSAGVVHVDLDSFELFRTAYMVDRDVLYGAGVNASAYRLPVPEPSARALFLLGGALLAATGLRSRRIRAGRRVFPIGSGRAGPTPRRRRR